MLKLFGKITMRKTKY